MGELLIKRAQEKHALANRAFQRFYGIFVPRFAVTRPLVLVPLFSQYRPGDVLEGFYNLCIWAGLNPFRLEQRDYAWLEMPFHYYYHYQMFLWWTENADKQQKKEFLDELELMKTMVPHPNIVGLIACCTKSG